MEQICALYWLPNFGEQLKKGTMEPVKTLDVVYREYVTVVTDWLLNYSLLRKNYQEKLNSIQVLSSQDYAKVPRDKSRHSDRTGEAVVKLANMQTEGRWLALV